jgi:MFS family permease
MSITREAFPERRQQFLRWSAVLAGAAVSVGLWLLLQMLGAGIGLSSVDAEDPGSLRSAGIGTGIWTVIAPLVALFIGGFVASRISGTISRRFGVLHGLVLWSITAVVGFAAVMTLATGFARSAAIVNRDAVQTSSEELGVTKMHGGLHEARPRNDYQTRAMADTIGNAMLWGGLAMLLGLGAALAGGAAGARVLGRNGRHLVRGSAVPVDETLVRGPAVPAVPAVPVDENGRPV